MKNKFGQISRSEPPKWVFESEQNPIGRRIQAEQLLFFKKTSYSETEINRSEAV